MNEELKKLDPTGEIIRNNNKEYARQHKSEKKYLCFHGGCVDCVTPLYYGLGNCLGCLFFNGVTSKFPDLGIRDKQGKKPSLSEEEVESEKKNKIEEYAYANPVYSRMEILDLLKKCFPDRRIDGAFSVSASIQIHRLEEKLRELGFENAKKFFDRIMGDNLTAMDLINIFKESINKNTKMVVSHTHYDQDKFDNRPSFTIFTKDDKGRLRRNFDVTINDATKN